MNTLKRFGPFGLVAILLIIGVIGVLGTEIVWVELPLDETGGTNICYVLGHESSTYVHDGEHGCSPGEWEDPQSRIPAHVVNALLWEDIAQDVDHGRAILMQFGLPLDNHATCWRDQGYPVPLTACGESTQPTPTSTPSLAPSATHVRPTVTLLPTHEPTDTLTPVPEEEPWIYTYYCLTDAFGDSCTLDMDWEPDLFQGINAIFCFQNDPPPWSKWTHIQLYQVDFTMTVNGRNINSPFWIKMHINGEVVEDTYAFAPIAGYDVVPNNPQPDCGPEPAGWKDVPIDPIEAAQVTRLHLTR